MARMDRRQFLTTLGAAGVLGGTAASAEASGSAAPAADGYGVLVDLTECIGCRKCEWACNTANNLPAQPLETFEDKSVFAQRRRPDAGHYTVVNEIGPRGPRGSRGSKEKALWVKVQCMHCQDPACASACIVSAFTRQENGAVTYDPWRCMGCRYCMVACPFQIPTYEYDEPFGPTIRKCTLCFEKMAREGGAPACVEICPPQCLTYGKRSDLVRLAHRKIADRPGTYVDHVYGEHEVGGTSWLYVSDRPFEEVGLPTLPRNAPPRFTEKLQHGIFKNFIPPVGLYAVLGAIAWLFRPPKPAPGHALPGGGGAATPMQVASAENVLDGDDAGDDRGEEPSAPVRRKFWTRGTLVLSALALLGFAAAAGRFLKGLGPLTNLDNQYPWGIWIAIDVAAGVALAAGGFTTAALAHIFHRDRYRAIMRPALLSAMLGYTFVVLGLLADLGKYYNVWHPMLPSMWSGHSVLFEVGMCVMVYLSVLYLEFAPIVVERFRGRVRLRGRLARFNPTIESLLVRLDRALGRAMFPLVIAGVVLSCLHQSSLGSLMLIAPSKMHPLWYTPILPLLFLLSAIAVGYPVVILESLLSARAFGRKPEMRLLERLGRIVPILLGIYLAFKVGDLAIRGAAHHLLALDAPALLFIAEITIGVLLPLGLFLSERARRSSRALLAAAVLVIAGVVLNRVNVFLTAYTPVYKVEQYLPSVAEVALTVGLFSTLILAYRAMVSVFPVLPAGDESDQSDEGEEVAR